MEALGGIAFGLFFLLIFVVAIGGNVLWIYALVEVAKVPEPAFRTTNREKTNWILVVALGGLVGALVWWFGPRQEVKAAALAVPIRPPYSMAGPPPGWYPDPSGRPGQCWWDGAGWTGHRQ